ncbi:MAG: transglutaminase-like cysteine peptidase [Hyphomicrobiales bacterium]
MNTMFTKLFTATALVAMVVIPTEASAFRMGGLGNQMRGMFITERAPTLAPMGHVRFCMQNPAECRTSTRGGDTVTLDKRRQMVLRAVNTRVNGSIRGRNETGDVWQVGGKSGDCEDFALTKRSELIRRGFPASALRIATARTPRGEGHAVLMVRTSEGDVVLDNRTNTIKPWNKTDLRWVSIQSTANPRYWKSI